MGFPGSSDGKEPACNVEDLGLIPGSGRSPREGNGNPLQQSCLENPVDRGAWWATAQMSHKESGTTEQLTHTHIHTHPHTHELLWQSMRRSTGYREGGVCLRLPEELNPRHG